MDGGKNEAPPAPDYTALARQQGQENRDTARWNASANRINEYTPFGSRVFTRNPSGGMTRQFDQSGYEAALRAYQSGAGGGLNGMVQGGGEDSQTYNNGLRSAGGGAAPNAKDFYFEVPNGEDTWSATTTLSPEQQALYEKDVAMRNRYADIAAQGLDKVGQNIGTPLDLSGLGALNQSIDFSQLGTLPEGLDLSGLKQYGGEPDLQGSVNLQSSIDDYSNDRQRVEAALMERMAPQLARDEESMRQRMANQGITLGSEAYGAEAMQGADARNRARLDAILSAGQEQSRLQGDALRRGQFYNTAQLQGGQFRNAARNQSINEVLAQRGQGLREAQAQSQYGLSRRGQLAGEAQAQAAFGNQARAQALQEILTKRSVPMNEINALRSGSQMTAPQFQAYNNSIMAAPANIYGAGTDAYNAQMGQYNAGVASDNAMMSGLFGLGSAALTGGMGGGLGGLFGLGSIGGGGGGYNQLGMLELMR